LVLETNVRLAPQDSRGIYWEVTQEAGLLISLLTASVSTECSIFLVARKPTLHIDYAFDQREKPPKLETFIPDLW
jgi:hypothetical protein